MIQFHEIGKIHTPYIDKAPYQPIKDDKGDFQLILDKKFVPALKGLEKFRYIYVIYFLDKIDTKEQSNHVSPPWVEDVNVGVFASRSPDRPNPIGLSIVELIKIEDNIIFTSGLDVFDNTPILDIKPYIRDLDAKVDADYGWLQFNDKKNREHLLLHIQGNPH